MAIKLLHTTGYEARNIEKLASDAADIAQSVEIALQIIQDLDERLGKAIERVNELERDRKPTE